MGEEAESLKGRSVRSAEVCTLRLEIAQVGRLCQFIRLKAFVQAHLLQHDGPCPKATSADVSIC